MTTLVTGAIRLRRLGGAAGAARRAASACGRWSGPPARATTSRASTARSWSATCATPASMARGHGRRAPALPRRRRLPAVGARSRRDPPRQPRGDAGGDGGGARGRRRAHRLHQQRRHPARRRRRRPSSTRPRRCAEGEAIGAYKRSKVVAERLVERMVAERGLPAVIVNPSTPIGPRDIKPTPTGRIIVEAAHGRMPGLRRHRPQPRPRRRRRARATCWRMEKGRIGERYILGGQDVSLREMLADIAELTGRKRADRRACRARRSIRWPAPPRPWRRSPARSRSLTRDALKMAAHHMFFTSAKAERELGYARPALPRGAGRRARLVPRRRAI